MIILNLDNLVKMKHSSKFALVISLVLFICSFALAEEGSCFESCADVSESIDETLACESECESEDEPVGDEYPEDKIGISL